MQINTTSVPYQDIKTTTKKSVVDNKEEVETPLKDSSIEPHTLKNMSFEEIQKY